MIDPEHILHVEDSDEDAQLINHLLRSYAYRVSRVRTYGEMVDFRGSPDVVLLDLRIPGSDSPLRLVGDTVRRFRGAGIILLTGISDREGEELSVKAMAAGAQIRLVKGTFDSRRLWLSIREAFQQRQHLIRAVEQSRSDMRIEPKALRDTIRGVLDQDLSQRLQSLEASTATHFRRIEEATNKALSKLRKLGAEDTAPIEIAFDGKKVDIAGWFSRHDKLFRWLLWLAAAGYIAASDYVTGIRDAIMDTRDRVRAIEEKMDDRR